MDEKKYTRQEILEVMEFLSDDELKSLDQFSVELLWQMIDGKDPFDDYIRVIRELIAKYTMTAATLEKVRDELQRRQEQAEEEAKKPKERPFNPLLQDYYGERSTTHSYYRRNTPWI